jgi:hypothetical protein
VFLLTSVAFVSVHLHIVCVRPPHSVTSLVSQAYLLGSREQNYRPEDCGICHSVLIGRKGSGFWEGGKGMPSCLFLFVLASLLPVIRQLVLLELEQFPIFPVLGCRPVSRSFAQHAPRNKGWHTLSGTGTN